jgi:DNA-binding NarL/FixJ family response regulator
MPPDHRVEGIEAAYAVRSRHPEIGVVVLSQHADEGYAFQLLQHGTAGLAYLLKERVGDRAELLRAVRERSPVARCWTRSSWTRWWADGRARRSRPRAS